MCSDFLVFWPEKKFKPAKTHNSPTTTCYMSWTRPEKKIMIRNNDVFRLFMCFHSKNYCFWSNLCFKILLTIIDIYKSKKTDVL